MVLIQLARPRLITALAIMLFAVTIGGVVLTILFGMFFELGVSRYLIVLVGIGYSVSALASAVGLWRMAPWSVGAFILWGAFAVALTLLMRATAGSPSLRALGIAAVTALAIAGMAVYIARQLREPGPEID